MLHLISFSRAAIPLALLAVWLGAQSPREPVQASPQQADSNPASEPTTQTPRPLLGIEFEEFEGWGILATRVVADSAAARCGVKPGDAILSLGGRVTETIDDMRKHLQLYAPGDAVQLVFRREDKLHVVRCWLGDRASSLEHLYPQSARLTEVLAVLQVEAGQTIADIGCGSGWLSLGLSEATGPSGRVYAVEIDEAKVIAMRARQISNLRAVHSTREDVRLEEDSLDLAVMHDVASHVDSDARPAFYKSVAKALRPQGQLVIFGPHGQAEAMLAELALYGFHPAPGMNLEDRSKGALDQRLRMGIHFVHRPPPPEEGD